MLDSTYLITEHTLRINDTHPDYAIIKANVVGWPLPTALEIYCRETRHGKEGLCLVFQSAAIAGIDWGDVYATLLRCSAAQREVENPKEAEIEIGRATAVLSRSWGTDRADLMLTTAASTFTLPEIKTAILRKLGRFLVDYSIEMENDAKIQQSGGR